MPSPVPYTGLSGLPSAPGTIMPDAYNRTQADPNAFGAGIGRGEQQLGAGLEQAGDVATNYAIAGMRLNDETATDGAYDQLNRRYTTILHGDPNDPNSVGYLAQQGSSAMSSYRDTLSALEQARSEIAATLSPRQQAMFEQSSRRLQSFSQSSVGQHYSQQQQVWRNNTSQSLVQGAQQAAVAASDNDTAFKHQLFDGVNAISQLASQNGWSGDVAQQRINSYISETWSQRVDRIAASDPNAAWQLYQANQRAFTGTDQAAVEHRLIPQVRAWGVRSAADGIVNGGGPTGPIPNQIATEAQAQGVDPTLALTAAKIESNLGTSPDRPGSQYQGVFQLGNDEWSANGGTAANRGDPQAQVKLGVAQLAKVQQSTASALGRDPAPWEVYMAHQQGIGGLVAYQQDPNRSAIDAMASTQEGQQKGRAWATQAVLGNIPSDQRAAMGSNPTSAQFLNMWQQRYARVAGSVSVPTPGAAPPSNDPATMLPTWIDQARHARDPLGIDDPLYQDQLVSEVRSRAAQIELGTKLTDQQNEKTLLSAALGIPDIGAMNTTLPVDQTVAPGAAGATQRGQPPTAADGAPGFGRAPLTISDLLANPQTRAAWSAAPIATQMRVMSLLERNAKAAAAPPPVTPETWDAFGKLNGMAATDPEGFAKLDLSQYADQLPRQWLMKLYGKQYGAQTAQSQQAQVSLTHAQEVMRPALEAAGITVSGIKAGSTQADALNTFVGKLSDALEGWTVANPGKKPTDDQVLQLGNSLLQPGTVKGSSGWFSGPTQTRAFQSDPTKFQPTVPPADKAQIISAFQAAHSGQAPSDDTIAGIFMARQSDLAQRRSTAGRMAPIAPPPVLHQPGRQAPVLQRADAGDSEGDE